MNLPKNFEEKVYRFSLLDGTDVLVRRITPEDKKRIQDGFKQFSPRSRYLRFFSQIKKLTLSQLAYLTEIDYQNHTAWGMVRADNPDFGIGISRYVRMVDEPEKAEIAISVIDPMHNQGVATILLAALSFSARNHGIKYYKSFVLFENKGLVESLKKINGVMLYRNRGVYEVTTPVFGLDDDFPETSTGYMLQKRMLEFVQQALADS